MPLQALFLDLYETLITEFQSPIQSLSSIAKVLHIDQHQLEKAWREHHHARMVGNAPDFVGVLQEICLQLYRPVDIHVLKQLEQERLATKAIPFEQVEPAILDGLEEIRKTGVALGLISNCASEEIMAWPTSQLASFFDDTVFSYQVGLAKPDVRIYQVACDRMGVEPGQAIFVGDGGHHELFGATQAGLTAYRAGWFWNLWPDWWHSRYSDVADYSVLHTFDELCSLVKIACR